MPWKTIPNGGAILEESHLDRLANTNGISQVQSFLPTLAEAFVQVCLRHYNATKDIPIGDEWQTQSALLPAIYQVADAVLVEGLIERNKPRAKQKKPTSGRLDYRVWYQPFVFLIEYKVPWINLPLSRVPTDTQQKWQAAMTQLQQISAVEANDLAMNAGMVLKIALLVAPSVQEADAKQKLHPYSQAEVTGIHQTLSQTLGPDWICTWATPRPFGPVYFNRDKVYESYPSVSILAKIVPL